MTANLVPAAQYLRMSTEHQQYSLQNQSAAIAKYALANGYEIVQTYVDSSRTGIVLKHRDGLRRLLDDVMDKDVCFKAILVYDVSRWGRFQDADEAAHYEFLCRSAGIPVHYSAEPFSNDGTATDTLLKTIKRTMAAEYSRELGVKIAAGQRNVFQHGFRGGGGLPGFALRRMLVSADGIPKQVLAEGERKAIQTDRVILIPGPPEEVAWLHEIYRLFIEEVYSYREIAETLNEHAVPYHHNRPWNLHAVKYLLTNTKYNGWLTYGKWTRRLQTKCRRTPNTQWLRVPHLSAKLIDDETFAAAQRKIRNFTIHKSNEQLLDELRNILAANGKLSMDTIRRTPGATVPAVYRYRFGSLVNAFQLIGYHKYVSKLVVTRRRVQQMRTALMQQLHQMFPRDLSIQSSGGWSRSWLETSSGVKISVNFCIQPVSVRHTPAWCFRWIDRESNWTTLIALLDGGNTHIHKILLFPTMPSTRVYVSSGSPVLKCGVELDDLHQIVSAVAKLRR